MQMGEYKPITNAEPADIESGTIANIDESKKSSRPAQHRLVSLDVFRGITVALMILVDDAGAFIPAINHSPWDGVNLADFVMPFFLFIVGVALALAYKRVSDKSDASKKAVLRALKLFALGLFLQGGYFHGVRSLNFGVDLTTIRVMGVLQRIAIAYLSVAICEIWLRNDGEGPPVDSGCGLLKKYRYQLLVGFILTIAYTISLYGLRVSDWEYSVQDETSALQYFLVCVPIVNYL
jgi:heparan-alpha-glucosaminide N-acetyltransferase